jgi:hypothetical protein
MVRLLETNFAKGALSFEQFCDMVDALATSLSNFDTLRRLAFLAFDLNCDEHISDVDVIAYDSFFIQGQQTAMSK